VERSKFAGHETSTDNQSVKHFLEKALIE